MADYKGLNITFRADATEATKALHLIQQEAKAAQGELTAAQNGMKNLATNGKELNDALKSTQLQAMGDKAKLAGEKAQAYSDVLEGLNKRLEEQQRKLVANRDALASFDVYDELAASATEAMKKVTDAQQALAEATKRVEFSGNTQDWVQALNDQAEAQRNLNTAMAEGDAAFEQTATASERYVGTLKGAINAASESIEDIGNDITRTHANMLEAKSSAAALAEQVRVLNEQTAAAQTNWHQWGEGAKEWGATLTSIGDSISSVGDKMSIVSGVALATFGRSMVSSTEEFGNAISQLGGYLDIGGSQLDKMREQALEWGKETQFSATEAADAMNELAKGGMTQAQISGGAMAATMELAAAGGLDMASAAEVAVQSVKTFGMSAEESSAIADALAGAATKSTAEVSDLAAGFKYAGAQASLANWDINEVTGALALMADHGLRGEMAGTALANVMKRLATPTDTAAAVMKQYGIEVRNADGTMKGAVEVVQELQDKLGGLNDEAKSQALNDIFQTRGLVGAVALLDEGADKFQEYIEATEQAGYASEMADARMGDLGWALEYMRGEIETATVNFGQALAPTIIKVANAIEGLTGWFNGLSDGTKTAVANTALLVAGFGPMLSVLGHVTSGIGGMLSALGTGAQVFASYKQVAGQTGSVMGDVARAYASATLPAEEVAAATAGIERSMTALATGGAVLLATAIGGHLIGYFIDYVEHADMVRKATTGLDEAVRGAGDAMAAWSTGDGPANSFRALADAAKESQDALSDVASYVDDVSDKLSGVGQESHELDTYVATMNELANKSGITAGEVDVLKDAVAKYNEITGASIGVTDDMTGALNVQPEVIDRITDAYKRQVEAQAYMELWKDAIVEQAKVERELADVTKEYTSIQEKYSIKLGDSGYEISMLIGGALDDYRRLAENKDALEKSNERLISSIDEWREKAEATGGAVTEYDDLLRDLGMASKDTADSSGDLTDALGEETDALEDVASAADDAKAALDDFKRQQEDDATDFKRRQEDDLRVYKAGLEQRKTDAKNSLKVEEDQLKDSLDRNLKEWKDYYSKAKDLRKSELQESYDILKDSLDNEYDLLKDSLDAQYKETKKSMDAAVKQAKSDLDKEVSARKSALDSEMKQIRAQNKSEESELKKSLDAQYNERSKAAQKIAKQWQKQNQKTLKEAKATYAAETKAFKAETSARIAEIKREYEAKKQAIADNDGTRELDERIAAIKAEQDAEDAARRQRERDEKTAELRLAVEQAKTRRTRQDAEQALSDYLAQLAEEDADAERERQIQALEDRKSTLAEETKAKQAQLDDERDRIIADYESKREVELEQLTATQDQLYERLQEKLDEQLELKRDKQSQELEQYRESLDAQLTAMQEAHAAQEEQRSAANQAEIEAMQEANAAYLENLSAQNEAELASIQSANQAALDELAAQNEARLKLASDANAAELEQLDTFTADEIQKLTDHNAAVLKSKQETDAAILKDVEDTVAAELLAYQRAQEDAKTDFDRAQQDALKAYEATLDSAKTTTDTKMGEIATKAGEKSQGIKDAAVGKVRGIDVEFGALATKAANEVGTKLDAGKPKVKAGAEVIRKEGSKEFGEIEKDFGKSAKSATDKAGTTLKGEKATVKTAGQEVERSIVEGFDSLSESMKQKIKDAVEAAKGELSHASLRTEGQNIAKSATEGLESATNGVENIGQAFASGFARGIENNSYEIENAARNAAINAYNAAMNELNAHSPSRKMMEVGKWYDEGFAIGIERNSNAVTDEANAMVKDLIDASDATGGMSAPQPFDVDALRSAGDEYLATYRTLLGSVESMSRDHMASMEEYMTVGMQHMADSMQTLMGGITSAVGQSRYASAAPVIVERMEVRGESDIRRVSQELYRLQRQGERRALA